LIFPKLVKLNVLLSKFKKAKFHFLQIEIFTGYSEIALKFAVQKKNAKIQQKLPFPSLF
jgi:hypothetical protein